MPFNTAPKPGRGWDTKDGKPPKTLYLTDPEPVNVEIVLAHLRENPWTRYSLFSRGGELVEPNGSDLRVVTANKLRTILHNKLALQWHAAPSRSDEPPQRLIQAILERAGEEMPAVSRVSTVPAMFQDGIQDAHGLDEGTGVYFAISNDDAIAYENFLEVDEARKLLLEDLLGDFPFVSSADRANALAAMLVPFVRDVIDGPTPLHLIEKPTSRTGATLLARCLTVPFGGVESQWPKKEAEREKVILGKLRSGTSVVWFDNVTGRIDSPALNTVLTARSYSGRLLYRQDSPAFDVRSLWLATANNARVIGDLTGRTVRIKLDAGVEFPGRRTGPRKGVAWRHPNLEAWARAERVNLVRACLGILWAWKDAGMPRGAPDGLGGFEEYVSVLRGLLSFIDVGGFLGNLTTYDEEDEERDELATLMRAWLELVPKGDELTAKEILSRPEMASALPDTRRTPGALGTWLGERRDRPIGEMTLRKRRTERGNVWRVEGSSHD